MEFIQPKKKENIHKLTTGLQDFHISRLVGDSVAAPEVK